MLTQPFRVVLSFLLRPLHVASIFVSAGLVLLIYSISAFITADQMPVLAESAAPHAVIAVLQGSAEGQQLFNQNCTGCHTIGGGVLVGPDLKDITQSRDPQWIKNFITDPSKMVASDPAAQQLRQGFSITMPTLGLTSDQIDQLVAFLGDPGTAAAGGATTLLPVFPVGVGDSVNGRQIYLGGSPLTYGGPPCIACHTVQGAAVLGGGSLGPDLTHVVQRLGEGGVASALQNIAFPTMAGPFQNHPLTVQEQADLVSFLKVADLTQPPVPVVTPGALTTNTLIMFSISVVGAALLFGLLYYLWRPLKKQSSQDLPVRKVKQSRAGTVEEGVPDD